MTNFVSLNIHQEVPYSLNKYLSYDYLSHQYRAYIAAISSVTEPKMLFRSYQGSKVGTGYEGTPQALKNNNT